MSHGSTFPYLPSLPSPAPEVEPHLRVIILGQHHVPVVRREDPRRLVHAPPLPPGYFNEVAPLDQRVDRRLGSRSADAEGGPDPEGGDDRSGEELIGQTHDGVGPPFAEELAA